MTTSFIAPPSISSPLGVWADAFRTFGIGQNLDPIGLMGGLPIWALWGAPEREAYFRSAVAEHQDPSPALGITTGEEVGYVDFDVPLGQPNPDYVTGGVLGSVIASVTGTYLPEVRNGPVGEGDGPYPGAPVSDRPAFPEGSIYGPEGTWGQSPLPPGVYDIPYEDTRPDEVPPPPIPEEGGPVSRDAEGDPQVAIDWGDVFGGVLSDIGQGLAGGNAPTSFVPSVGAAAPPATVTVDTRTGKVTPCRRRRRRRLLTSSDLNDLAALKTIVGGGQALNGAVIKAVRR